MKYYKIDIKSHFPELGRIASGAEGKNVPEKEYFYRIGKREIIENTPIFDYFVLKSFDKEKYWEWALFDIHNFIGVGSIMCGWYISDKLKSLLEKFKYWIFQFPIEPLKNIIFEKSNFYYIKDGKQNEIKIKNESEFMQIRSDLFIEEDIELECSKVCLLDSFDIVYQQPNGGVLCSEHLKQAIEENGITGFEFFEIDYEVVAE